MTARAERIPAARRKEASFSSPAEVPMRRFLIATAALVLASATSAFATPSDDVANAFMSLGTATSYHMAIQTSRGQTMDADVAKPNKMHVTMAQMEMISVAGGTYVKVNGNWMKLPTAIPQMQSPAFNYVQTLTNSKPSDVTVDDLGSKSVDGATYHAYKVTSKEGKPATMYVDGSGVIARIDVTDQSGTSIVRFSKFNAPVSIEAPI
jgi:hypothetical protein